MLIYAFFAVIEMIFSVRSRTWRIATSRMSTSRFNKCARNWRATTSWRMASTRLASLKERSFCESDYGSIIFNYLCVQVSFWTLDNSQESMHEWFFSLWFVGRFFLIIELGSYSIVTSQFRHNLIIIIPLNFTISWNLFTLENSRFRFHSSSTRSIWKLLYDY